MAGTSDGMSRRRLFGVAAAGAAVSAVGAAPVVGTAEAAAAGAVSQRTLLGGDQAIHLLRRASYGPSTALIAEVRKSGTSAWLEKQLNPAKIPDPAGNAIVAAYPRLSWTPAQVGARMTKGVWTVMDDLGAAHLARACWSSRQLLEVMVDFWSNHLNVTTPISEVWATRHHYDREVIRRFALGRFEDMLIASAKHPAMVAYLDNGASAYWSPNENYGRELLELHTVGIEARYTEADVRASTLLLTGFTVDPKTFAFRFDAGRHYKGALRVMGFTHANATREGGLDAATAYLRYLARHPSTAKRLARKLAVRFVSDAPPAALVDRLAKEYLAKGTAIAPVLRMLFNSAEFKASIGAKTRRPMESMAAAARVLGVKPGKVPQQWTELYWMAKKCGHAPLAWTLPDGYPDVAEEWRSPSQVITLWQQHAHLSRGTYPKLAFTGYRALLPAKLPKTWGAVVDHVAWRVMHGRLQPAHRAAALAVMQRTANQAVDWRTAEWPINGILVPLILNSPYHWSR